MNVLEAAKAVVERWDTPLWKDVPHTAEYINNLRAAIAEMEKAEPFLHVKYDEESGLAEIRNPANRPWDDVLLPLYTHPPIHEGWQLVPVEPTDEMCRALWRRDRLDTCGIIWERVLQAAPKPEDV